MKTVFLIVLLCVTALCTYAQDTLYRTNGKIVTVTIQNSDYRNVYYKIAGDAASPVYTINKSYISKIVHQDGHTEAFEAIAESNKKAQTAILANYQQDSLKNLLMFKVSDLAFGAVAFEYEHFMKSGNFGLRIPLAVGFVYNNKGLGGFTYYADKLFSTGVGIYFYPFAPADFEFFVGTSVNYWKNKDYSQEYSQGTSYYSKESFTKRNSYSFLLETGFMLNLKKHFVYSMDIGFGYGTEKYKYSSTSIGGNYDRTSKDPLFELRGSAKIGYKF